MNVSLPASIWAKSTDPAEVEKDLRDAFSMVDVDGSGEVDSGSPEITQNGKQATAGMKTCIPYITLGRAVFGLSGQN